MLTFLEISYVKTLITLITGWVRKHANVILVHKKEIKSAEANCRPVDILPNLWKINVSTVVWTF